MQTRSALWLTIIFYLIPACKGPSMPPASDAAMASADGAIDAGSGDARAPDGGAGRPIGAPCLVDADCATGQCLTEAEDPAFMGGYCTIKNCTDGAPTPCPDVNDCRGLARGSVRICLGRCELGKCRAPYRCCGPGPSAIWCAPSDNPVCLLR